MLTLNPVLTAEGVNLNAMHIKAFMKEQRRLLSLLSQYEDQESKSVVDSYIADMEAMLATVRKDAGAATFTSMCQDNFVAALNQSPIELPKAIQDALFKLASEEDIRSISREILASLENIQATANTERVDVELDDTVLITEWKEGVEELRNLNEDSLWTMLGFPDKQLPFFQHWTDPDAMIDPWSEEGQQWLTSTQSGCHPLKPRWHQLIGIYRMLERAFEGKPVLLMDGVSLGKTLQVVGTIACLAFYRESFKRSGKFPGDFGVCVMPSVRSDSFPCSGPPFPVRGRKYSGSPAYHSMSGQPARTMGVRDQALPGTGVVRHSPLHRSIRQ